MNKKIVNHRDISIKFAFKTLGEFIHNYFGFEGEYLGLRDSEVITLFGENLRKDISYKRTGQIINNIELQSYKVDKPKLRKIAEYIKYILRNDDQQLANSIILTTVNPKNCERSTELTKSLILEPVYIYIPPDKVMEMFNNIKNKVLTNQILNHKEELEFIITTIFSPEGKKSKITSEICYLFEKYSKIMDYTLNLKISFVLWVMIERNISDNTKKEELIKVIDMEEKIDSLQELIDEERKEDLIALRKANTIIKEKEETLNRVINVIKKSQDSKLKHELTAILKKT